MLNYLFRVLELLRPPTIADVERLYLEGAESRVDLEMRQREISAGRFRQALNAC